MMKFIIELKSSLKRSGAQNLVHTHVVRNPYM